MLLKDGRRSFKVIEFQNMVYYSVKKCNIKEEI